MTRPALRMEKIIPFGRGPWEPPALPAVVPSSGDGAAAEARDILDVNAYRVYTDGSGIDGEVAAAVALFLYESYAKTLRFQLGPLTEYTVYEAEGVALTLVLHLLLLQRQLRDDVNVGVNNYSILTAGNKMRNGPDSHIIRCIEEQADALQDRFEDFGGRIQSQWTPGHERVRGNEFVDEEAKAAAAGTSSASRDMHRYLRLKSTMLPIGLCVMSITVSPRKDRRL
jgi:ribonuclease HI